MAGKFYSVSVFPVRAENIGDNYNWGIEDGAGRELLHMTADYDEACTVFHAATANWAEYTIVEGESLDKVEYETAELAEYEQDDTGDCVYVRTVRVEDSLPENVQAAMCKAEANWHYLLDHGEYGGSWHVVDNM